MKFTDKLARIVEKNNSLLCVGLDPDTAKLPEGISQFEFNKQIIDATHDLVCAYKPNSAFYESQGAEGIQALKDTCDYLRENHADIPIILDYKRGDIGNTNAHYAKFAYDYLGVDAVTWQPYLGSETFEQALGYEDKGFFVLIRTSNPGGTEVQDLQVDGQPLYEFLAQKLVNSWNASGNVMLVAGATYPEQLGKLREITGPDMPFLVPGIGAQSGDTGAVVNAGLNENGTGLIVNSSRGIIFSVDPRQAAIELNDAINKHRGTNE